MKFTPHLSVADLAQTTAELVRNTMILEPKVPAAILAERIVDEAETDFLTDLQHSLLVQHFERSIRAERARDAAERRKKLLPAGFDQMPWRIVGDRRKLVRADQATYADAKEYCRYLNRKRPASSRVAQAEQFRDRLQKASKKKRGITAGEALGFDFGE